MTTTVPVNKGDARRYSCSGLFGSNTSPLVQFVRFYLINTGIKLQLNSNVAFAITITDDTA